MTPQKNPKILMLKKLFFLKTQQNIEIPNFEAKKMMYENIRAPPPPPPHGL